MSTAVESVDFDRLSPYEKRTFVPEGADLLNKDEVVALYQVLLDRAVDTRENLEQWVRDRSEFESALDQAGDVLYIKMTCQTDNPEYVRDYKNFQEIIVPAIRPLNDRLNRKYLDLRETIEIDPEFYRIYDREIRTDIELYREENVELHTRISALSQEYQAICGAMTIEFQSGELTLPQAGKFLLDPDRKVREDVWRKVAGRRLKDRDRLNELFDQLLAPRHRIAVNAGFPNFMEYQFKAYHRFDYTPDDVRQYHRSIEEAVLPLSARIMEHRRKKMGVEKLRPWDTAVDILGRSPLRPFDDVNQLKEKTAKIFHRIDPQLGGQFDEMRELGLLNLASRKGKAPGGYQNVLAEARKPFIFMNAVGVDRDVMTLLHEGGHAFHSLACADQPLHDYRHAPMEFCEVASMAMELLGSKYLEEFYSAKDKQRSRQQHFEDIIYTLVWVAAIDAFQQWIYLHPEQTAAERTRAWRDIYQRFGGDSVDWSGFEDVRDVLWHRQLHIFEVPFYYIEYGIAQLGALQLWRNAQNDQTEAVADYKKGLTLGGSRPLPELYKTAGIRFDFSKTTIEPLVRAVERELDLT